MIRRPFGLILVCAVAAVGSGCGYNPRAPLDAIVTADGTQGPPVYFAGETPSRSVAVVRGSLAVRTCRYRYNKLEEEGESLAMLQAKARRLGADAIVDTSFYSLYYGAKSPCRMSVGATGMAVTFVPSS